VAERVQHAFAQPFRLGQSTHSVGTSIGIALFPTDAQDAPALLERADIAMYSVKTNGKHGFQFYESKFYNELRKRLDKEANFGTPSPATNSSCTTSHGWTSLQG
jgi:predicted signal transduction protein with EAL and GGDEF domain